MFYACVVTPQSYVTALYTRVVTPQRYVTVLDIRVVTPVEVRHSALHSCSYPCKGKSQHLTFV